MRPYYNLQISEKYLDYKKIYQNLVTYYMNKTLGYVLN